MSVDKQQFQLLFTAKDGHPQKSAPVAHEETEPSLPERVAGIDQALSRGPRTTTICAQMNLGDVDALRQMGLRHSSCPPGSPTAGRWYPEFFSRSDPPVRAAVFLILSCVLHYQIPNKESP